MASRRWVDLTERAIYLRVIPVTAQLASPVLHAVAQCLVEREVPPGESLLSTGKKVRALSLITEGRVALLKDGKRVGELVPPQSAGFLNIVAGTDAPYDAICETTVSLLELSAENLLELFEDQPSLLQATIVYMGERLLAEMKEMPQQALGLPSEVIPLEVPARELDLVERMFFLRCMSAFKHTNVSALSAIAEQLVELRRGPGESVFELGAPPEHTVFVVKGTIGCETEDGRRFQYGPGTAVGGLEALASKPRWYSARAETEVVALLGRVEHLLDVVEDNFEFGMAFVSTLAQGLSGILAAKASMGQASFNQKRNVSKLGAVPVGA